MRILKQWKTKYIFISIHEMEVLHGAFISKNIIPNIESYWIKIFIWRVFRIGRCLYKMNNAYNFNHFQKLFIANWSYVNDVLKIISVKWSSTEVHSFVKIFKDILALLRLNFTNDMNNFILQLRNRLWIMLINQASHITPKKMVQWCPITWSWWLVDITASED